jgi:murein DD-endopeptidase MepM/ murein hydrolase activator NlpD
MFDPNNSRTRGVSKIVVKIVSFCLTLSFLFPFLTAEISWSGENPAEDAMKIAVILPKKSSPSRGNVEEAAGGAILSVRETLGLMRQAQVLSAMLPPKKRAVAPAQKFEPGTPMSLAAKTPNFTHLTSAKKTERNSAKTKTALERTSEPAKSKASRRGSTNLIWPVEGQIYSAFNAKRGRRKHGAIDIVTKKGVPIAAAADGVVTVASNGGKGFGGYGKLVIIDHGKGLYTLYAHCDKLLVKTGQRVKAGEYIATVGRTGRATTNHCHFEVRVAGKKYDPLAYLPKRPDLVKANDYRAPKRKRR